VRANGLENLCAACVHAANDFIAVGAKGGRQRKRGFSKLIRDRISVTFDRLDGSRDRYPILARKLFLEVYVVHVFDRMS